MLLLEVGDKMLYILLFVHGKQLIIVWDREGYLNFSFNKELGLKLSTNLGGISSRCLVVGLTDIRSTFFFTSKVPNPCTEMGFASPNCCVMIVSNEAVQSEISLGERSNLRANSEVNSLLFKVISFQVKFFQKVNQSTLAYKSKSSARSTST